MVELIAEGRVIGLVTDEGDVLPALSGGAEYVLIAGAVAAVAAAVIAGYSAYQQGQAQKAAFKYNKTVQENQAIASRDAAVVAEETRANEIRRILGAQTARLGASGVIPTEGSPLLVQMESASQGALDLARIRYAGRVQAQSYESAAILQGFYGTQAARAGNISAGTSLLSGVSNAAAMGAGSYRGGGTAGAVQSQAP